MVRPLNDVIGNPLYVGDDYVKNTFTYDKSRGCHDLVPRPRHGHHRLNVYAGLAGFYIVHDTNENTLVANNKLPQSHTTSRWRSRTGCSQTDGQLYYPAEPEGAPRPSIRASIRSSSATRFAEKHGVTAGRISQLRRSLETSWAAFQQEAAPALA